MTWIVAGLLLVALALAVGALVLAKRRRDAAGSPTITSDEHSQWDASHITQLHREADRQGTELLQRRVALDMRRGTLGGDSDLDAALEHLEQEWRRGTISDEQFEAEKLRLLGG